MITALRTGEDIPYIPIKDRKLDNPTIFRLRSMSEPEERYLNTIIAKGQPVKRKGKGQAKKELDDIKMIDYSFTAMYEALHIGLLGATNFKYSDGKPAKWERDKKALPVYGDHKPWTQDTIMQIPKAIRTELSMEIMGLSEVIAKEKKELEKNC